MIVWNVTNRWFATKAAAEAMRKELKLAPTTTRRADIRNREELAALLDGQCWLPELHRVDPKKQVDPRQLDLLSLLAVEPGDDTKAGLAAISAAGEVPGKDLPATSETAQRLKGDPVGINLSGFPPPGDPLYSDPDADDDSHLETYETEPDGTRFDPETGEVIEREPVPADRGASC